MPTALAAREISIVDYLAGKNVRTWQSSGDEIQMWCVFCERHQRDKGRLYLNVGEGVYYCFVCQATGTTADLLRHFGDDPGQVKPVAEDFLWRRRILDSCSEVSHETALERDDVLGWLLGNDRSRKQRGLSAETIRHFRLGYLAKNWSVSGLIRIPDARLHMRGTGLVYNNDVLDGNKIKHKAGEDFFRGPKVMIPYYSLGHCVQMRGRDFASDGRYYTGPDEGVRLFNTDSLRDADEVLIVEGEFDAMVVWQAMQLAVDDRWRRLAVVGLAGVAAIPSNFANYFRDVRRVYVGLDPDEAGRKAAIKVRDIIGAKARIVELPDDLPKCDWTELLVYRTAEKRTAGTWRDVVHLLEQAGAEQRRLCGFGDALDSYLKREEDGTVVPFGWHTVDSRIEGNGVPAGGVAVVATKTGVGKTLIACNMVVNHIRMGLTIPSLIVSLEMPRADVAERLVKIWRFYNPEAEYDEMRAAFEHLLIYDRNRVAGKELPELLDEFDEIKGCYPAFVIVDHLTYYCRWQRGATAYDRTSQGIMELKEIAKDASAAMLVPTQVNRIAKDGQAIEADNMRDSGIIEETADYLVTAWRPDDALPNGHQAERTGKLQGSLEKNRRGPKKQRFSLLLAQASLAIVDSDATEARIAHIENQQFWAGKTYAEIRQPHQQGTLVAV